MPILVTTDGSPHSLQAVPQAIRLGQAADRDLLLLLLLDPLGSPARGAEAMAEATKSVAMEPQSLATDAGSDHTSQSCSGRSANTVLMRSFGSPPRSLLG